MSLFGTKLKADECGVIIDIGSASVGVALVVSKNIEEEMDVIWSFREYETIKDVRGGLDSLRSINTAIVNALLELGSNGLKVLRREYPSLKPIYVQATICAPWSYTITKSIEYENEHPFEVDDDLILQLVATAKKQTMDSSLDDKIIKDLGLRLITEDANNMQINGYTIKDPIGQKGRSVTLSHISAVVPEKILKTLEDSLQKIMPRATVESYSFMYLFYRTLKDLHPDTSEVCLIDVTNEATEIGIVRDNVLRYTTHIPYGMYKLAREIALECEIPKEEAYSYIKEGRDIATGPFSDSKKDKVKKIFEKYEDAVAELFAQTGDSLSIPKTLFLHTTKETEEFFSIHLKNAAKKATAASHTVHLFTTELLGAETISDSALAMSAYTFHTREHFLPK